MLACDMLNEESHNNIEVRKNTFGKEMLRYMRNAKVVVIALDDDTIAAGQLVLLHAMNMGVPVIITRSHGVTDDYVIDHYNGLIIDKTEESLLTALTRFSMIKYFIVVCVKMGKKNLKIIIHTMQWEKTLVIY